MVSLGLKFHIWRHVIWFVNLFVYQITQFQYPNHVIWYTITLYNNASSTFKKFESALFDAQKHLENKSKLGSDGNIVKSNLSINRHAQNNFNSNAIAIITTFPKIKLIQLLGRHYWQQNYFIYSEILVIWILNNSLFDTFEKTEPPLGYIKFAAALLIALLLVSKTKFNKILLKTSFA